MPTSADGTHFTGPVSSTNGFIGNQVDSNGNEVIIETGVASAVNEITVTNAATGNAPSIIASGGDTNVGLSISAKGTGAVTLWTGAGTREALILANTASAVNEVTITQAATGASPSITGSGGDTNVGVRLGGKGTGLVSTNGAMTNLTTVTTITTAGAVTFTAAQLLGGLILRNPNGAGRADVVPTAALMVAAIPGAVVGDSFRFIIRNTAGAAETITLTPDGAATTISGTATIAQNNSKEFLLVLTNVTASSEAYTIYSLGTVVF